MSFTFGVCVMDKSRDPVFVSLADHQSFPLCIYIDLLPVYQPPPPPTLTTTKRSFMGYPLLISRYTLVPYLVALICTNPMFISYTRCDMRGTLVYDCTTGTKLKQRTLGITRGKLQSLLK